MEALTSLLVAVLAVNGQAHHVQEHDLDVVWGSVRAEALRILRNGAVLALPPFKPGHPLSQNDLLDFGEKDNRNSKSISRSAAKASVRRILCKELTKWPPRSQLDSKGGVDPISVGGPFLYSEKVTVVHSGDALRPRFKVDVYNQTTAGMGNGFEGTRTATFASHADHWILIALSDYDKSDYQKKRFGRDHAR